MQHPTQPLRVFLSVIIFILGLFVLSQPTLAATAKTTAPAAKSTAPKPAAASSKDQLIKDVLPLFVQVYGSDPNEDEKSWWRKRISCGEIKNQTQLVGSMQYHKDHKARRGSDAICGQKLPAVAKGVIRRSVAGIGNSKMGDQIRVGIYNTTGAAIGVTVDSTFQIRQGTDKIVKKLKAGQIVKVSWSGGQYHVRGSGVKIDTNDYIRIVPENLGIVELTDYKDLSRAHPGLNYNKFRGVMEIRKCDTCNELWAINELRVEYYIRGLGETSGNGPDEYLKALSIAARTYALYHKVVTGGRYDKQHFDVGSTATDQIYRGREIESVAPRVAEVFGQTKGIIATNSEGDVPIATVYFSDSDGRTRTAKEVWNTSRFPYLQKSVKDPYHVSKSCLGHCVGMSAQGAYGFASKAGWNFQRILNYYYQDIKLVKAY
jgi:hypothetical protein